MVSRMITLCIGWMLFLELKSCGISKGEIKIFETRCFQRYVFNDSRPSTCWRRIWVDFSRTFWKLMLQF